MHDHIKDLGREIVRQEGPKDKEQRSRIWNKQDALDILTTSTKKENNKIEGILLDALNCEEIFTLSGENCVNLNTLRFLHLERSMHGFDKHVVQVEGSFENVLPNLRLLSLQDVKMKRLNATNFFSFFGLLNTARFNLKKLVVLNFSHLDVTESWATWWKEFKDLPCLEVLDLSHCPGLKKTPDLSNCTSLKRLLLSECRNLEEIDGSITSLTKLQHLDLSSCDKLKNLPDSIGKLVRLEVLLLGGCFSLVSLPNSLTSLPKLDILVVTYSMRLQSFPDSAGEMVQLTNLDISGLKLNKLPEFMSKQKRLEFLRAYGVAMQGVPTEIEELHHLREIIFDESGICGLPSLVKLSCLEKLSLRYCYKLEQLPELPTSLVQLHVSSPCLQSIPDYSYLIHLTNLELDLTALRQVSESDVTVQELNVNWIWRLSNLKNLRIIMLPSCTTTVQSKENWRISKLKDLTLHCSVLETFVIPRFLSVLRKLDISLYRGTTSVSLPRLNHLTHFSLSNSDDLGQIIGLGELESLMYLVIKSCHSLERLDDISKLRRLRTLEIRECKKLGVISVVPCPQSLKKLEIIGCESLESLVGPSESQTKSCFDDIHLVESWKIVHCPLLENKLAEESKRSTMSRN